jgi:small subunit ribosomal protein S5
MSKEKDNNKEQKNTDKSAAAVVAKSVYGEKKRVAQSRLANSRKEEKRDEFEQQIVDIARVTRVMAGGKRMRFRACVAIGNKKGEVAIGLAKGADVAIAVSKAVNKAKKNIVKVPIVNGTIPHEIYQKEGAAKILFKPGRKGRGVIAGGAVRVILELAGIKNITSKILGTNNKVNNVKCVIEALGRLKKVEKKEKREGENKKKEKNEISK